MVRIGTAIGIPTPSDVEEEHALQSAARNQLSVTRKTAEAWRAGLVGLLATISALAVVGGPTSIQGLDGGVRYAVGILLLVALVSTIAGSWWALKAANGSPRRTEAAEIKKVGGFASYEAGLADESVHNLNTARSMCLLGVACVVMAIGLSWYGPKPTLNFVVVNRPGEGPVCGRLVSVDSTHIILATKANGIAVVPIDGLSQNKLTQKCQP